MITKLTKKDLIKFEDKVAETFNAGKIRAPVHLYYGNEEETINIFQNIEEEDWVLCSWRSHYQCLLKGVPEEELIAEILEGRSISLSFPKYRILSSGIVGGVLPIATGIALSIKEEFPSAYEAYKSFEKDNGLKLGTVSSDNKVINIHAQEFYGYDGKRYLNYEALALCLESIKNTLDRRGRKYKIGLPY